MRRLFFLLAILLASPSAMADFCSVDNFGNITSCFPSADMCQQWARTSQGRCVLRSSGGAPSGGTGPNSGNPDWLQGLGNMARQRSQELQQGRDATPGWIAPLSPSSNYLTPALVNKLTSQLNNMLEMSQGRDFKPWKSSSANGFMSVEVGAKNQFGDICREFVVTLDYSSERKGIKGNACRSGGTWRILGSVPLEFRDGKIVETQSAIDGRNESSKKSPGGGQCKEHLNCANGFWCDSGTCVPYAKSSGGGQCVDHTNCANGFWCDSGTCVLHAQKPSQIDRESEDRARQEAAGRTNDAAEMRPGKVFKDCADCPEMVVIPAGSFEMGSPASEAGRMDSEGPQHRVVISAFVLAKTEITRGQFEVFAKDTGYSAGGECIVFENGKWEKKRGKNWRDPGYTQLDNHPAVCVNWDDAKAYVSWLALKTGKPYRLPSEAEWEYAARAGATAARYWGESPDQVCGHANVADQTIKSQVPGASHSCTDGHAYTAPVASYKANVFGLHDMIGNAWEWTDDCWNKTYSAAPSDGRAWTSGDCMRRMRRGGSWLMSPQLTRSAFRLSNLTSGRTFDSGFRPARSLP